MAHHATQEQFWTLFHQKVSADMVEVMLHRFFGLLGKNLLALSLPFVLHIEYGFTFSQVALTYFVWMLTFLLATPFIGSFSSLLGIKHTMSTRALWGAFFWGMMPFILSTDFEKTLLILTPLFFLRGLTSTAGDMVLDVFLAHHSQKSAGKTLAWFQILIMLAAILSPIVGGAVTYLVGFEYTAYMALVAFAISGGVLFLTPDHRFDIAFTPKNLMIDSFKKAPTKLILAEVGIFSMIGALMLVWPLFLIMSLDNVMSMGILVGVSSGAAMIMAFVIGRKVDKAKSKKQIKKTMKHGSWRSVLINTMRASIPHPIAIGIADILDKINDQTVRIPHDVCSIRWIHEKNTGERASIRLVWINLVMTIFTGIVTLILFLLETPEGLPPYTFAIIFGITSLLMLLVPLIQDIETTET